jgi:hypothetical protein
MNNMAKQYVAKQYVAEQHMAELVHEQRFTRSGAWRPELGMLSRANVRRYCPRHRDDRWCAVGPFLIEPTTGISDPENLRNEALRGRDLL